MQGEADDHPILITGGTGFIGSYLAMELLERDPKQRVVIFGRCFIVTWRAASIRLIGPRHRRCWILRWANDRRVAGIASHPTVLCPTPVNEMNP